MKVVLKDSRRYVLKFEKGEEVFQILKDFLNQENIKSSVFNGIGACNYAELAYYDLESKTYKTRSFSEDFEILSLIGNSSVKDSEVILHSHATLSKSDFSAFGGHAMKMVVSVTCEIFLIQLDGEMQRALDLETNLNLLV